MQLQLSKKLLQKLKNKKTKIFFYLHEKYSTQKYMLHKIIMEYSKPLIDYHVMRAKNFHAIMRKARAVNHNQDNTIRLAH